MCGEAALCRVVGVRCELVCRGYTTRMVATTIKVPSELRDKLNAEARSRDITVAGFIEHLIAERDRAERFRQMRAERAALTPSQRAELAVEYTNAEAAAVADLPADAS